MEAGDRGSRRDVIERVHDSVILFAMCVFMAGCLSTAAPDAGAVSETDMKLVAGGSFRMGSDLNELDSIRAATGLLSVDMLMAEVPGHTVTVADFYMDAYDVTNENFAKFVAAKPSWSKTEADPSLHNGRYLEHWKSGTPAEYHRDHPVTFITWQAAVAYCDWRGKRLPTEIEFEWAAQDGRTRSEYPWGNASPRDDIVNWGGNGIDSTVPVGSYAPNARGLYDMSGNVWHFTADPWLGSYAEMLEKPAVMRDMAEDPDIRRVVRGGSWGASTANLRVRYRDSHRPSDAREMVGFRCAKSTERNSVASTASGQAEYSSSES